MNKKIYFNHKYILIETDDAQTSQDQSLKTFKKTDLKNLQKILADFLKDKQNNSIKIVTQNFEELLERLKKIFYYIEAAGGFIEKKSEFLFIHRHQRWDLPKGKLEKGESIENAAIRECEEECGIKNLNILYPLSPTYHIYPFKSGYALKQTFWFYMQSEYAETLIPQLEEDIDEVKWFSKPEIISFVKNDTYHTINDIIAEALKLPG